MGRLSAPTSSHHTPMTQRGTLRPLGDHDDDAEDSDDDVMMMRRRTKKINDGIDDGIDDDDVDDEVLQALTINRS